MFLKCKRHVAGPMSRPKYLHIALYMWHKDMTEFQRSGYECNLVWLWQNFLLISCVEAESAVRAMLFSASTSPKRANYFKKSNF